MAISRATWAYNVYKGDNPVTQMVVIDVNSETGVRTPVDLSRFNIRAEVRPSANSSTILLTLPIVITDAANGIFQWQFTSAETQAFPFVSGVFDIQMETKEANVDDRLKFTFITGTMSVTEDVTKPLGSPFSNNRSDLDGGRSAFEKAAREAARAQEAIKRSPRRTR